MGKTITLAPSGTVLTYSGRRFSAQEDELIAAVRRFVRAHSDEPPEVLQAAIERLGLPARISIY